jgi:predicted DNA-binding transcriptional regulator YafY
MSKLACMFKIVTLLQTNGMISSSRLAEILDTNVRNIKAYIESIRMAGVQIEGISGPAGGYYISEDFAFYPPCLDDNEFSALLFAEKILTKESGYLYENEFKTAVSKIKAALNKKDNNMGDYPDYFFSRANKDLTDDVKDKIPLINDAIAQGKTIEITYCSPMKENVSTREVDPYGMVYRHASWYLVGFCHLRQKVITFKILRMISLSLTDREFRFPYDFSINKYMENTLDMITGKEYEVEIQFFHPASVWVSEKLWLRNQKIQHMNDGSIIFEAKVRGLVDIKKWVLGFGRLAKVIGPKELIDEIIGECDAMKGNY